MTTEKTNPAGSRMPAQRRKRWTFRLLLSVIAPLFVLLTAEGLLRLFAHLPPVTFLVRESRAVPGGRPDVYVDNPYFGYAFSNPALARAPAQNVIPVEKKPGVLRVLVIGESAAMGFPLPEFGLARMLRVMLSARYPGQTIEIIDGTMTMINSHILLKITDELANLQPDVTVFYVGNNEAIGPFGPAGVFGRAYPQRWMVRVALALDQTCLVRELRSLWHLRVHRKTGDAWLGLDHFQQAVLAADDPRVLRMVDHYEANMRDMIACVAGAGSRVVVCVPPVNLADWPPLRSLESPMDEASRQQFWACREQAARHIGNAEWENAVARLDEAVRLDPGHAQTWYERAICLERVGRKEEAANSLERACRLDGYRFRTDEEQVRRLKRVAADTGATLVDVRSLLGAIPEHPQDQPPKFYEHVHLTFVAMSTLAGNVADAVGTCIPGAVTGVDPDRETLKKALLYTDWSEEEAWAGTRSFLNMNVFQGQAGYTERLKIIDERKTASWNKAKLLTVNDLDDMYQRASREHPDDWTLGFLYGRYLIKMGAFDASYAVLSRTRRAKPNLAELENVCGFAALQSGRLSTAESHFEAAIGINQYNARYWNSLGLVRYSLGRRDEALKAYEKALALQPDLPEALNNMGYFNYAEHNYEQALAYFNRVLELQPDMWEARYHRGLVLLAMDRAQAATVDFKDVLVANPLFPNCLSALATAYLRLGNLEESRRLLEKAYQVAPDSREIRINLGFVALKQKDAARAKEVLAGFASRPDASPDAKYVYGKALVQNGDLEDGLGYLRLAATAQPNRADWLLALAEALLAGSGPDHQAAVQEAKTLMVRIRALNQDSLPGFHETEAKIERMNPTW